MTTEEIRSAQVTIPEVPGILTGADVLATARAITEVQRPDGMIPWFEDGHCDPWNHVEAAMALTVCGLVDEAKAAYRWLAERQLPDGSWFNYYRRDAVKDSRLDTNVCAYLAAGAWHHHLITGDVEFLGELWPAIEGGIDFVLRFQQPDGSVLWSRDSSGRLEKYALLTGSSSIYHSLRCAVAVSECLAKDRPDWELAAGRLGHAVAHHPGAFAPKVEFAMDWYYPMLSGALEGDAGRRRIAEGWSTFVMEGLGVRCVSTGDWVTAAETAECVLTLDALGLDQAARELFTAGQNLRLPDGSYWTGWSTPKRRPSRSTSARRTRSLPWSWPPTRCPTRHRRPACSAASAFRPRSTWRSRTAATPPRAAPSWSSRSTRVATEPDRAHAVRRMKARGPLCRCARDGRTPASSRAVACRPRVPLGSGECADPGSSPAWRPRPNR
jgi:hypothetical protein